MQKHSPNSSDGSDTPNANSQPTELTESVGDETRRRDVDSVSNDEPTRTRYGRYTVQKMLGAGGFGRVYLAEDEDLKRLVALKIPRMTRRPLPRVLEIHRSEAQTVAKLDIPGVVPIYDIGMESDGAVYIVSKYIHGSDLHSLMERKHLDREEAVRICKSVAETLHAVHLHNVVHRDIKPGNILVDDKGTPFVSDFGLALTQDDFGKGGGKTGTLRYMSPEQVRGESHLVDGRSDIFALGVILYELLTGSRPFDGPDTDTVLHCIQFVEPKPLRQFDDSIPIELERICIKSLAKKASDRYATGQDFANDLSYWLDAKNRAVVESTREEYSRPTVNVVPRGLRAFRGRDSAFFLDLVPGPRDREGLPDLVRHWKLWISEKSTEDENRVGALYGPSGCGKSSMLHAGIVPLLGNDVDVVTIQASADPIERQLKRVLRRRSPPVEAGDKKLNDMSAGSLIAHRRDHQVEKDKPLLLVIDQFEHWLLNLSAEDIDRLAMTLRQCDGVTTKALLLVRDDFWVALGRFLSVVDVPLVPDVNCSLVDLFDPAHAQKVLESFGRAYGRLPAQALMKPEHTEFLSRAVDDLTRAGKVYPVQLALFAEMLKGRPWVPETLDRLGGVEGIGTRFLEEAFEAEHAPVKQRIHEDAARRVLESLLPEAGSVRNRWRTREELLEVSGYRDNPGAFNDLINILDSDLRLISPTDRLDTVSGSQRSKSESSDSYVATEESTFQLSHDFLIPSLREWVSRKQLETYRGRVKAQMTEMAGLWSAKHGNRFLPGWSEWVRFRLLIRPQSLNEDQQEMMRFASRRHVTNSLICLVCFAVLLFAFLTWQKTQRTRALLDRFASARFAEIPVIATELDELGGAADERLAEISEDSDQPLERRIAAEMVLHDWDDGAPMELVEKSLDLSPKLVAVVADYFRAELAHSGERANADPEVTAIWDRLWEVLEDDSESESRRLSAAQLLVEFERYTSNDNITRRQKLSSRLARILVSFAAFHPSDFQVLTDSFLPAKKSLSGPLSSSIGQHEPSLESSTAINILLSFNADDPEEIIDLALGASPWQLRILVPVAAQNADVTVPELRDIVRPEVNMRTGSRNLSRRQAIRMATAAALLARLSDSDPGVWNLLRFDSNPTLRCTMIHRFADVDVLRERIMQRLVDEQEETVAAALLQALGQYPPPESSDLAKATIDRIVQHAVGAREAETMSSAKWLARQWKLEKQFEERVVATPGGVAPSPNWRITDSGMVMVSVDAISDADIGRVFLMGSTEVSVKQFQQFRPNQYYANHISTTDDCPMNVVQWHDAMKYCRWLSEQEDIPEEEMCFPPVEEIVEGFEPDPDHVNRKGYRLPTVKEWQYACRAGTTGELFFGEYLELMPFYAVVHDPGLEVPIARPCGSRKPNALGLFDMFGNIMEWTSDKSSDERQRETCGASYAYTWDGVRVSKTRGALPSTRFNSIGFRVVRTVSVPDKN